MGELVRDEPHWTFHDSLDRPVTRHLRVWRTGPGRLVAVITEHGPGMSVTNAARQVVEQLHRDYPDDVTTIVEHYPTVSGQETFDEIRLGGGGEVTWRRLPATELRGWINLDVVEEPPAPAPVQPETTRPSPAIPLSPPPADDTIFHGHPNDGPGEALVTVETTSGDVIGLLKHLVKRSTGFSWGYEGSGPAELARCLLIAALGSDLRCSTCAGTAIVGYNPDLNCDEPFEPSRHDQETAGRCTACDGGTALAPGLYQQFKRDIVARWPQNSEWRISAGDITAWVRDHG